MKEDADRLHKCVEEMVNELDLDEMMNELDLDSGGAAYLRWSRNRVALLTRRPPPPMKTGSEVLEFAKCDPATGAIVLHLRGRQPLRLTASPAALRALKAAVMGSYAYAAQQTAAKRPAERHNLGNSS
jgi:hypothetical protein